MYIYLLCTIPLFVWKQNTFDNTAASFHIWVTASFLGDVTSILTVLIQGSDVLPLAFVVTIDFDWYTKSIYGFSNLKLVVHFIPVLRKYFWQCQVTKVFWKYNSDYVMLETCYAAANWCSLSVTSFFNVAPCMLPHLLYNPTHALFTL
jgi:hypothetical protein